MEIKFQDLVKGVDEEGDNCILFKFVDRKTIAAYNDEPVTLYIYPNPEEEFIDAYANILEYFKLLDYLDDPHGPADHVFTNIKAKTFATGVQKTTDYLRNSLKLALECCGICSVDFSNHSLRHGRARFNLYNFKEIRYIAGWSAKDDQDTLGKKH